MAQRTVQPGRPCSRDRGIRGSSFVYRTRRPFDPVRFRAFLDGPWPGVIRAKGHFWLARRPRHVGLMSAAGVQRHCEPMGLWWAAVPRQDWLGHPQFRQHPCCVGRLSGQLGSAGLVALEDPFPAW
ncbi:cobalamin synthesis protein P47K (plasmid) [Rhizobium favelukesii]|uniref:Cobalamin synthesis protein P47K n=1 Tax=Rhizobium favelukesii TaxID=348824 RepID=W6RJ37_9HYPH|nr:cobalamin synthesis protein P47K [Rhizobium favelukesii]